MHELVCSLCSAGGTGGWAPCLPSLLTAPSLVCQKRIDRNSTTKKPGNTWVQLVRKFSVFHRHLILQEQKRKVEFSGIPTENVSEKGTAPIWKSHPRSLWQLLSRLSSPGWVPGYFKGPMMHHGQPSIPIVHPGKSKICRTRGNILFHSWIFTNTQNPTSSWNLVRKMSCKFFH